MTNVSLDTCALLWLASGDNRLSETASTVFGQYGIKTIG